jgi:hypothetical protein
MAKFTVLILLSLLSASFADFYMARLRGSNNRLNEQAANRNNGDRLFDSQNNNRGGYNVCDRTNTAFSATAPTRTVDVTYDETDRTSNGQYPEVYFEGSTLPLEWTNQHGCGGNLIDDPNKLNCQIIIQYMCETPGQGGQTPTLTAYGGDYALNVYLYDGGNTNTPDEPNSATDVTSFSTYQSNNNNQRGRHESEGWYYECKTRSRNKGLFFADQNPGGQTAIITRQNPNGNRRGLECPEERDYYPYWVPSPWRDIAYLTDRLDMADYIIGESMNQNMKYKCKAAGANPNSPAAYTGNTAAIQALTPADCATAQGVWTGYTHGMSTTDPRERVIVQQMPWTRDNHLGNGRDGQPISFNWTLPDFDSLTAGGAQAKVAKFGAASNYIKCVLRIRYNMTTDDYDPWNTTSAQNNNPGAGIKSPVTQNPTVDVGAQDLQGLALAINTNQFGRTFQDRSHVFYIKKRPAAFNGATIWNLNVRGKRGNIVQTYPAVEYDFVPNLMTVHVNDLIHFQWCGSNTHNNGDPAGDGQAGDAGEGTGGTDRSNWVESGDSDSNYPLPLDKYPEALLMNGHSVCYDFDGLALDGGKDASHGFVTGPTTGVNCALTLATSGQFLHIGEASSTFDPLLNNAPAALIGGIVVQPKTAKPYYNYINTRNNNFSNRAQKGAITVLP